MGRLAGDPTGLTRLRYTFGGRLAEPHREWVRHDLTDAGWRWRLLGRVAVQLAVPVAVIGGVAVSLSPLAGLLAMLLLVVTSLGISAMVADQLRDRRLHQHDLAVPRDPDAEFRERRPY